MKWSPTRVIVLMFTKSAAVGATSGSGAVVVVGRLVVVRAADCDPFDPPQATKSSAASAPVVTTTSRLAPPLRLQPVILGIRLRPANGSVEPVPLPRRDRLERAGERDVRGRIELLAARRL